MSNCSEIRQIPIIASFGDVFGGTYCPKGEKNLKNCPVGYYCGTPEDRKMCPEGEFCSHKSLEPWIDCGRCAAGSTGLKRDAFGYLLFGIGSFLLLLAIGFSCLRSYKKEAFDKQVELLARKAGRMSLSMNRKRIKKQVDSVRPHLEIINKRLSNLESTSSSIKLDGKSQFSIAPRLYDILDIDKNELSYDELNAVLQLNEQELNLFVKRMQELSGNDQNQTTISRRCFVQYFLQVLEENVHFTITQDEAEAIYNEILEENRTDTVDESMLYASSISNYLSDIQIYLLVKVIFFLIRTLLYSNHLSLCVS